VYLTKASADSQGITSWELQAKNPDNMGNTATMSFSIGVSTNKQGIFIGGKGGFISWDALEAAKKVASEKE